MHLYAGCVTERGEDENDLEYFPFFLVINVLVTPAATAIIGVPAETNSMSFVVGLLALSIQRGWRLIFLIRSITRKNVYAGCRRPGLLQFCDKSWSWSTKWKLTLTICRTISRYQQLCNVRIPCSLSLVDSDILYRISAPFRKCYLATQGRHTPH